MHNKIYAALVVFAAFAVSFEAEAAWKRQTDDQIKALFGDGLIVNGDGLNVAWRTRPDGSFEAIQSGEVAASGTWSVEKGQFCRKTEGGGAQCAAVERDGEKLRLTDGKDRSLWKIQLSEAIGWRHLSDDAIRMEIVGYRFFSTDPDSYTTLEVGEDGTDAVYEDGTKQYGGEWEIHDSQYCGGEWCHEIWQKGDEFRFYIPNSDQVLGYRRAKKLPQSQPKLTADEIKQKLIGRNFNTTTADGIAVNWEIRPDGSLVILQDGSYHNLDTRWKIDGDAFCVEGSENPTTGSFIDPVPQCYNVIPSGEFVSLVPVDGGEATQWVIAAELSASDLEETAAQLKEITQGITLTGADIPKRLAGKILTLNISKADLEAGHTPVAWKLDPDGTWNVYEDGERVHTGQWFVRDEKLCTMSDGDTEPHCYTVNISVKEVILIGGNDEQPSQWIIEDAQ